MINIFKFVKRSNLFWKTQFKFRFSSDINQERQRRGKTLDETTLKNYNSIFKLSDRGVVSVSGEDATAFLQGLITNDMNLFQNNPNQAAIFSLFLNPKGRILFDGIIVKSHFSDDKFPEYWIDVNKEVIPELINHLGKHIIRKRVNIQDMSSLLGVHSVHSLLSGKLPDTCKEGLIWKELQESAEYVESETDPEVLTTDSMSFYDPRHRTLGGRIICPKDSLEIEMESFTLVSDYKEYHVLRHLYGIAEGPDEVNDQLPLNFNFHYLNGISFNKGCYIGQELTQRTYHTGVLRKTLMTFLIIDKMKFHVLDEDAELNLLIPHKSINREFNENLKDKEIIDKSGEVVGKIIHNHYNVGLALVENQKLEESKISHFNVDGKNTVIYDPISLWDLLTKIYEGKASEEDVLSQIFEKQESIDPNNKL